MREVRTMSKSKVCLVLGVLFTLFVFQTGPVMAATDAEVTAAIAGGQQYLYNNFVDQGTKGYWYDGTSSLAATAAAIAALIETGKFTDPLYKAKIDKGINYIKDFYNSSTGSISAGHDTYETGISLVALTLYDADHTQGASYEAMITKAVDHLIATQSRGSCQYNGGWTYSPPANNNCYNGGDLSNTQFAVMGLYYGSRYLGRQIKGTTWANALLDFLTRNQAQFNGGAHEGGFSYYPGTSSFQTGSMTGAGLWCLAMIGEDQNPMASKAVSWFNNHYRWDRNPAGADNQDNAYYYFVFGMAKALTGTIGRNANVGSHNWVQDLKDTIVANKITVNTNPVSYYWLSNKWLDPGAALSTAWVLMSLSFADINVESRTSTLGENPQSDTPTLNRGLVTLETSGNVTITGATRVNIGAATKAREITLPVGGFEFTLKNVKKPDGSNGGTTILSIKVPDGAFDPNNPDSFVDNKGNLKKGLKWFKIKDGAWKGQANIPIVADIPTKTIKVTLTDGGPGDEDGSVNGEVKDPGAPGYEQDVGTRRPLGIRR